MALRDRERQTSFRFDGYREDAQLAAMIARQTWAKALSDKQRYGLALIIHHGGTARQLRDAKHLILLNSSTRENRLLYTQLKDRIEIMRGRPQIFGTQYKRNRGTEAWELYPVRSDQRENPQRSLGI